MYPQEKTTIDTSGESPKSIWARRLGIASLIFGVLSLLFVFPLGFIPGLLCGHISRGMGKTEGFTSIGLILNYFSLALHICMVVMFILIFLMNPISSF